MCRHHHGFVPDFSSAVELTPNQAVSTHIEIDWTVDFVNAVLTGHVDITCRSQKSGECILTLDSRNLDVKGVYVCPQLTPLNFSIANSEFETTLGSPITVRLPDAVAAHSEYVVRVVYSTTQSSSALQWLEKSQTSSGLYPFMFSQCQAIHARSLLPCQDLCQVKITYSARIRFPSHLEALMSAVRVGPSEPCPAPSLMLNSSESWRTVSYQQSVPIPAYLIAVVCGELSSKPIGPRSTVWAEPSVVDRAAWEFEDTERMIEVAETLCGPYRFGVFDLLVLPPSFPYGGMENPCLTFVTPTLLAGDKSQTAVIAHELAHSWSGNLVTNETWTDFWMNEGLTVFTESKIVAALFGDEAASVRRQEGWDHLHQYVNETGANHNFTKLCPTMMKGADPDDAFSVVPYEKGASLFWYLQSLVGVETFELFIVKFFNEFPFKTISSAQFAAFAESLLGLKSVDWNSLFHEPGMPAFQPPVDPAAIAEAKDLITTWRTTETDVANWPSGKKIIFIHSLLEVVTTLTQKDTHEIASKFKFLDTNCEVRSSFISVMLRVDPCDPVARAEAVKLATEQGRMKYTRPMYKELFKVDKNLARETFSANRNKYHPICAKMVARDLSL